MLFMVIERFRNHDAGAVYERFRERGRMLPEGLRYVESWTEDNFERCFQWNPKTTSDARMRAARIYDKHLSDRVRAVEIYREITTHETDAKRIAEAQKRLQELSGTR